jgi:SAM-dependent methyltransferase
VSQFLKWPVPALLVWGGAWLIYLNASGLWPQLWAMALACAVSVACSALGQTRARRWALALGFPVSLWLSGAATLPAWGWLVPLALALLIYPVHAWHDAPIFPTPLNALRALPQAAPLPATALVLDAGCGVGDGLRALRVAYPQAQMCGIEFSWPLRFAAALRCPWARIWHGDIWQADWSQYDLVYLFQRPETMAHAVAKARDHMKPGAWLVSLEFEAAELLPTAVVQASANRPVWLYQAPFKPAPLKTAVGPPQSAPSR